MKDTIEIYIDGQLVDVDEQTELTLEIKSNFFTDIGDVESNRTWTVTLPKTVRNMALMGMPDRLGAGSTWRHRYHACEVRKNGIPLFIDGRATLDSCEDGIAMLIYWGVFPAFQKLQDEDKSLSELGTDLHLPFKKKNDPDPLADFKTKGYGYADYNELQLTDKSSEWMGWAVAQYAEVTTLQPLVAGKIRTGTETGESVSADRETDANYASAKIPFTVGRRAQVNGIVGQGDYRAYALLDSNYRVIDLADEPKATFGGDVERDADFRLTNTDYMYLVCEKEAATITKVRLGVVGRSTATTIEWGTYDPIGNANEKWGEQTVEANFVGVMEWTVERQIAEEQQVNTFKQYSVISTEGNISQNGNGGNVISCIVNGGSRYKCSGRLVCNTGSSLKYAWYSDTQTFNSSTFISGGDVISSYDNTEELTIKAPKNAKALLLPVFGTYKIYELKSMTEKPQNTYIYFTQSQSGVLTGYNVADNTGTYGENSVFGFSKNTSKSLCVTIEYDTNVPKQTDYNIRPTSDTAWLVVNADMRYSRADAVVKIFGTTTIKPTVNMPRNAHAIQPSVTVDWLLGLIASETGVTFSFPDEEKAFISTLAVPIIENQSDEETWKSKDFTATIETQRKLGNCALQYSELPDWLELKEGKLRVTQSCTATVEVSAYVDFSTDGWKPTSTGTGHGGAATYITSNDYMRLIIDHEDNDEESDIYIIGASTDAQTPEQTITANESQFNRGTYTRLIIGNGSVDFEEGDTLTLEFCNDEGTHKSLKLYDGLVTMQLEEGDTVPYGGNYPIGINLPDIKVLDFVKFLCLLTGTFPKQMKEQTGEVELVRYDALKARQGEAYDWTRALIPAYDRNAPRNVKYTTGEWCRHNRYKWKQDSETRGTYDADLQLDCETLDYQRDAWELPFAASDFNRVPIRTATDGSRYPWNASGEKDATYQYKACEPRIMNIIGSLDDKGNETAALTFNIDLQAIFTEKYETLRRTLERPHIITERLYLSDLEIMEFDETRPVYLQQYGQYFIVQRLSVSAEGWTEAELVQINN